jgi:hypothetical protein
VHLLTRIFDFTERDGRNRDPCFRRTPLAKKSNPDRLFDLKKLKLFTINNPPFRTRLPYPLRSGTSNPGLSLQLYRCTVVANANLPRTKLSYCVEFPSLGTTANSRTRYCLGSYQSYLSLHEVYARRFIPFSRSCRPTPTYCSSTSIHIPPYTFRTYGRINRA